MVLENFLKKFGFICHFSYLPAITLCFHFFYHTNNANNFMHYASNNKLGKLFRIPMLPRENINLPYSIRMYWMNFWQPTVHVQQNIFEKTLKEVCSAHFNASFSTFSARIGHLFEAHGVFEICLKIDKSPSSKKNVVDFGILPNV